VAGELACVRHARIVSRWIAPSVNARIRPQALNPDRGLLPQKVGLRRD
jgi:hypothetical protein